MNKQMPRLKRYADALSWSRAFIGSGLVVTPMVVPSRVVAARIMIAGFVAGYLTDLLDGDLARRSGMPSSHALDELCDIALMLGFVIGADQMDERRRMAPATGLLTAVFARLMIPRLSPVTEKLIEQVCGISFSGTRLVYLMRLVQVAGLGRRAAAFAVLGSAAALAVWRRERLMEYL